MTDQPLNLDTIEARTNAATPGPWGTYRDLTPVYTVQARPRTTRDGMETDGDIATLAAGRSDSESYANARFIAHAREDVDQLVAEVRRLQDELAEEKASHNPRLRCLIVKAARDKDMYVGWSNTCEMPAGVWSRETALEYGFPRSRLDRADANGSSDLSCGDGHWDDKGFIAEQRGWLRRELLGEYAVEWLHGDQEAAYALLEPFDDEPEPAARPAGAANEDGQQ